MGADSRESVLQGEHSLVPSQTENTYFLHIFTELQPWDDAQFPELVEKTGSLKEINFSHH